MIALLTLLFFVKPALADTPGFVGDFFSKNRQSKNSISYEIRESERSQVRGQGASMKPRSHDFDIGLPLSQKSDSLWRISAEAKETEWKSDAKVPTTNRPVPAALWNTSVTGMYSRDMGEENFTGTFTVGSGSDRPFNSYKDSYVAMNLMYRQPAGAGGKDATVLLLNFATNRTILNYIPIPGFAYLFNFSDRYKLMAGLPFLGFFGAPIDGFMITYYYFPPVNMMARVAYKLFGPAQLYTHFRWDLRNWYLSDDTKDEVDERIFQDKKEAAAGVLLPITGPLMADLSAGYEFGQRIFTGDTYSSRHKNRTFRVDSGWYSSLSIKARF